MRGILIVIWFNKGKWRRSMLQFCIAEWAFSFFKKFLRTRLVLEIFCRRWVKLTLSKTRFSRCSADLIRIFGRGSKCYFCCYERNKGSVSPKFREMKFSKYILEIFLILIWERQGGRKKTFLFQKNKPIVLTAKKVTSLLKRLLSE